MPAQMPSYLATLPFQSDKILKTRNDSAIDFIDTCRGSLACSLDQMT